MTTDETPEVIVVIKHNGASTLIKHSSTGDFVFDGETFSPVSRDPKWIGFYDWLRTMNGKIIGVRLQPDAGEIDEATSFFLRSLDTRNSAHEFYIFFEKEREFDPAISDDADFGGNIRYVGSNGSIAITFNAPTLRG